MFLKNYFAFLILTFGLFQANNADETKTIDQTIKLDQSETQHLTLTLNQATQNITVDIRTNAKEPLHNDDKRIETGSDCRKLKIETLTQQISNVTDELMALKAELPALIKNALKEEMNKFVKPTTDAFETTTPLPKVENTQDFDSNFNCLNCNVEGLARDCDEAMNRNKSAPNGIYVLKIAELSPYGVYCRRIDEEQGWTVIQRRQDDSIVFFNDFEAYRNGFGNLSGEYWLGLERLHFLTSTKPYTLKISMKTETGEMFDVFYDEFSVGSSSEGYKLKIGEFLDPKGKAYDAMKIHNGMKFSTYDQDNDQSESFNCAFENKGAWWYNACGECNLNGEFERYYDSGKGLWWLDQDEEISLSYVEMSILPGTGVDKFNLRSLAEQ